MKIVGILLAAGRGTRFDPSGERVKLLEPFAARAAPAQPLALAAARTLLALGPVVAVVRAPRPATDRQGAAQQRLRALLAKAGCSVVSCEPAGGAAPLTEGIGSSIACGVRASSLADGWIVALGDMPAVRLATVSAVHAALLAGAATAAPVYKGRRGHPVGFGAVCGAQLAALSGDEGARGVLIRHPPVRIEVDDPGVLYDVDRPTDLRQPP